MSNKGIRIFLIFINKCNIVKKSLLLVNTKFMLTSDRKDGRGKLKMNHARKLYAKTVIDDSDSDEIKDKFKIELAYYQVKSNTYSKPYGIEIVKRFIENTKPNIENKIISNICEREQDANKLLEILALNKVTPISADDVIEDLIKIGAI